MSQCESPIYIQQIFCKGGNIEYIPELSMMDFNRTSSCFQDLRVITHMNSSPSCDIESGEGFLGGNHVVGCSRIYQVRFQPREACLQGMEPLMIFYQLSNIKLIYSLWNRNIVMLKECLQLVNCLLHALDFWMKASHALWTLSLI